MILIKSCGSAQQEECVYVCIYMHFCRCFQHQYNIYMCVVTGILADVTRTVHTMLQIITLATCSEARFRNLLFILIT